MVLRDPLHYLLATIVLVIYGAQVCPFLDSLTALQLATPIVVIISLQWLAHRQLQRHLQQIPYSQQVATLLRYEFALFTGSGVVLALFNHFYYQFPLESGLKVLTGFLALGFFIAVDLSLQYQRRLAAYLQQNQIDLTLDAKSMPLSRKLALFASITALLVTTIFFLIINKDLLWLLEMEGTDLHQAQRSILFEFFYVALVILAHVINIIISYSRNLQTFFDAENKLLQQTNRGDLSGSIRIFSQDEFGEMAQHTNAMITSLRNYTAELQRTQDVTIFSLASLAETRDNETGAHILRTQRYVKVLAEYLAANSPYSSELTERTIELLYKSAPLHDIGKVGIPDAILLKPGKLDNDEFEIMKRHPQLGRDALAIAEKELGETSFLRFAREIAYTHHERWDGKGYPNGLAQQQIPLSGRLMAVADVYDALISKRVYKEAFSHDKATAIILDGKGSHFDPLIIDAFVATEAEFKQIAASFTG